MPKGKKKKEEEMELALTLGAFLAIVLLVVLLAGVTAYIVAGRRTRTVATTTPVLAPPDPADITAVLARGPYLWVKKNPADAAAGNLGVDLPNIGAVTIGRETFAGIANDQNMRRLASGGHLLLNLAPGGVHLQQVAPFNFFEIQPPAGAWTPLAMGVWSPVPDGTKFRLQHRGTNLIEGEIHL
ncbi:MAG: hypothetical protein ABH814_00990 [bacterium]